MNFSLFGMGVTSVVALAALISGCANFNASSSDSASATPSTSTQPSSAGKAADSKQSAAEAKSTAGLNAKGEVVDSSKVEAGSGQKVKGLNGWEGEITGKPAKNSKFTRLQIGMSVKQALDIAGQPSDRGAYVTGKAWIPFYFGGDRYRHEMVYKGQGRLIFAGGSVGDWAGGNLIWIIHNPNEGAYR